MGSLKKYYTTKQEKSYKLASFRFISFSFNQILANCNVCRTVQFENLLNKSANSEKETTIGDCNQSFLRCISLSCLL